MYLLWYVKCEICSLFNMNIEEHDGDCSIHDCLLSICFTGNYFNLGLVQINFRNFFPIDILKHRQHSLPVKHV